MSPTLTDPKERPAVFRSLSSAEGRSSNVESGATTDADIFRSWEYTDVADLALRTEVDLTEEDGTAGYETELRRVAASARNLLAWGRSIERGEGDKVNVDI